MTRHLLFYILLCSVCCDCVAANPTTATPMKSQQKKLFTLEDLNFGGTNYHNLRPKTMQLTWWGD